MENFCCTKCGSVDVFLDDRGSQKALMCNDCSSWIKWIGRKQLPFVERFIKENKENNYKNQIENKINKAITFTEALKETCNEINISYEQGCKFLDLLESKIKV